MRATTGLKVALISCSFVGNEVSEYVISAFSGALVTLEQCTFNNTHGDGAKRILVAESTSGYPPPFQFYSDGGEVVQTTSRNKSPPCSR